MPPKKKGKKKKKKKVEVDPNALTEVDKTFYELTITDLNRKLARLRGLTSELEQKNEELTQELSKVDEDRSDIIVYLKRMLNEKSDEIKEVQDRLTALEETRQNETEEYETKIEELDAEYKQMQETLTSEIKLLEGKLNALEEFRVQRDELMRKYEQQEIQMDEQEKRHKRELYETEKKFIIGKDKLKKEMEARLLQLSTEFHDATELRIASTTHRVIRENIAINNELEIMLNTHKRLHSENMTMKQRDRTLRQKAELFEAGARKSLAKSKIQVRLIERLNDKNHMLSLDRQNLEVVKKQKKSVLIENERMNIDLANLKLKVGLLEQNLHASLCDRAKLENELSNIRDENSTYVDVIYETAEAIRSTIFVSESSESEESLKLAKRDSLLNNLLVLLSTVEERKPRASSVESICSAHKLYMKGDLGFVPKPVVLRSKLPTTQNIECQTGSSLEAPSTTEDEQEAELEVSQLITGSAAAMKEGDEEEMSASVLPEEKSSILFFDEDETVEEESTVSYGSDDLREFMEGSNAIEAPENTHTSRSTPPASQATTSRTNDTTDTEQYVAKYLEQADYGEYEDEEVEMDPTGQN